MPTPPNIKGKKLQTTLKNADFNHLAELAKLMTTSNGDLASQILHDWLFANYATYKHHYSQ
jgi:hypothetical protein